MSPGRRPIQGNFPLRRTSPPTRMRTTPSPISSLPRSIMSPGSEGELARAFALVAEVLVGRGGGPAAVGSANHEPDLQKVWLDHLGQRLRLVVDRRGDRLQAYGAAPVVLDDGL